MRISKRHYKRMCRVSEKDRRRALRVAAENELLLDVKKNQILIRKLMSSEEIKIANSMVKQGYLGKGITDDVQKTVQFHLTPKGFENLDVLETKS